MVISEYIFIGLYAISFSLANSTLALIEEEFVARTIWHSRKHTEWPRDF